MSSRRICSPSRTAVSLAAMTFEVSYDTVRRWEFGPQIPRKLRQSRPAQASHGTSTRWSCGSPRSGCSVAAVDERSKSSTHSFRVQGRRDTQAGTPAKRKELRTEVANHR